MEHTALAPATRLPSWWYDERAVAAVPLGGIQLRVGVGAIGVVAILIAPSEHRRDIGRARHAFVRRLERWVQDQRTCHVEVLDGDEPRPDLVELSLVWDPADTDLDSVSGPGFMYGEHLEPTAGAPTHRQLVTWALDYLKDPVARADTRTAGRRD